MLSNSQFFSYNFITKHCSIPKSITGMWVKHVWDTTQVKYKAVLKNWFKGTGGRSGDRTLFDGWSDGKLYK